MSQEGWTMTWILSGSTSWYYVQWKMIISKILHTWLGLIQGPSDEGCSYLVCLTIELGGFNYDLDTWGCAGLQPTRIPSRGCLFFCPIVPGLGYCFNSHWARRVEPWPGYLGLCRSTANANPLTEMLGLFSIVPVLGYCFNSPWAGRVELRPWYLVVALLDITVKRQ